MLYLRTWYHKEEKGPSVVWNWNLEQWLPLIKGEHKRHCYLNYAIYIIFIYSIEPSFGKNPMTWLMISPINFSCQYWVKSVHIWSFSGQYFSSFGIFFSFIIHIQCEYEKNSKYQHFSYSLVVSMCFLRLSFNFMLCQGKFRWKQ